MAKAGKAMAIRNRVKELRMVPASELRLSPSNWRRHPAFQRGVLQDVLAEVGFAGAVLARETPEGLEIIDGHLRAEVGGDTQVPVLVLDVDEAEAKKGRLWMACYSHLEQGVVFERDKAKSSLLAKQRPNWAVYEVDCERALAKGAGAHLPLNFLDFDAWACPWDAIRAFFGSERAFPTEIRLVATDGLRLNLKLRGVCNDSFLADRGYDVYAYYLQACREFCEDVGKQRGYKLTAFRGGYCGHAGQMTIYAATFCKGNS